MSYTPAPVEDEPSPQWRYQTIREELRHLDYSQLSMEAIRQLHARHAAQGRPFASLAEACAGVPMGERYSGLQVQVGAPDCYAWWPTADLSDAGLRLVHDSDATAPEPAQPAEPDEALALEMLIMPIDMYAASALKGLLAGRHTTLAGPRGELAANDTGDLAQAAFAIGAAMVRERARYFSKFPVGTRPDLEATEL